MKRTKPPFRQSPFKPSKLLHTSLTPVSLIQGLIYRGRALWSALVKLILALRWSTRKEVMPFCKFSRYWLVWGNLKQGGQWSTLCQGKRAERPIVR